MGAVGNKRELCNYIIITDNEWAALQILHVVFFCFLADGVEEAEGFVSGAVVVVGGGGSDGIEGAGSRFLGAANRCCAIESGCFLRRRAAAMGLIDDELAGMSVRPSGAVVVVVAIDSSFCGVIIAFSIVPLTSATESCPFGNLASRLLLWSV